MSEEQTSNDSIPENKVNLDRRTFLQTAGLGVAGAMAAGTLLRPQTAAAQAGGAGNAGGGQSGGAAGQAGAAGGATYPAAPTLTERPLKPATLATTGISRKTHEEHYKLYQGYVRKTNELFGRLTTISRDPKAANATFSEIREVKVELSFALGGVKNHELYFDILGGGTGSRPQGALLTEINRSFGSPEAWAADMKATGIAARGWVWTAYDYDLKRLVNYIGDSQNAYPMWNATPIIGLDVFEHAYFIDYGTRRADYIDAFLQNLNWNVIATRFALATGPGATLVTPA